MERCAWVPLDDPLYVAYHDDEWGVPVTDDRVLFEFLILEGAQAGLSWSTILRKRDGYRAAYRGFEPRRVAAFTDADVERLVADAGIVRNRAKIESSIDNARHFVELQERHGSFSQWLWAHTDGQVVDGGRRSVSEIPAETDLSRTVSKELKRLGFRFVGPTIVYAYLQAVGVVDDHTVDCFRRARPTGPARPS